VVYREVVGNDSITVRLYGYLLFSGLDKMSTNTSLSLIVGPQRWTAGETPPDQLFPLETPGYLEQSSSRYPFRIITRISPTDYFDNIWRFSRFSLIAWALLSLVAGVWVFRKSGRMHSPEQELRRALEHREFIPYIQPVVSGENKRMTGCEVLMRWQHPRQGIISPDRFIPTAEHSSLIIPMTRVLMEQVREQFSPLVHQLPEGFHFGFNISAAHCKDFSLVEDCRVFIDTFRDNPITLILELTERELLVADDITGQLIAELHALGVLIAIDDFGTGNSSLSYLQNFSIDILKIDKSFVSMIGTDALSAHIVDNVIDLANRLDLKLVAEGVETEVQSAYLRTRNVTFLQGYLYGKPMPVSEFLSQLPA
ncbi:EAL domain-containing protein, partial [Buttiauxella sp. B2]|uniref:EAL domain-containing protein n=1 Tax=Buttiauxella sp. B2 TaxID=2587812 RepID=UPI00111F0260